MDEEKKNYIRKLLRDGMKIEDVAAVAFVDIDDVKRIQDEANE